VEEYQGSSGTNVPREAFGQFDHRLYGNCEKSLKNQRLMDYVIPPKPYIAFMQLFCRAAATVLNCASRLVALLEMGGGSHVNALPASHLGGHARAGAE
jgi:hypothetical protein